jgi:gluconolactonase
VNCYHPDGTLLARIEVPEIVANVTFGGTKRNQLFIAATTSIYMIRLGARGLSLSGRAA